jgi:uncharacterized membrane protein
MQNRSLGLDDKATEYWLFSFIELIWGISDNFFGKFSYIKTARGRYLAMPIFAIVIFIAFCIFSPVIFKDSVNEIDAKVNKIFEP